MSEDFRSSPAFKTLRLKAEQLLMEQQKESGVVDDQELPRLINELEVQHIELELQNEELRRTAKELEASRDAFAQLY